MKGKRLKDVLDEQPLAKTKWDMIFGKLKKLGTAIEMHYGDKMNIDDVDYRWVDDRIEYYKSEERLLSKDEMRVANNLWKKYGN
tara:strand:+ start:206 stop:457 length:252 start_codon:yes stop_codon:yes gene_type:complete